MWNHKRVYRVYKTLGLNFKKRTKKRIPARVQHPLQDLYEPNEQRSMDFMSNTLFGGKRYRILNIMDEFNREFIEFEVGISLPATKVIQALQRAFLLSLSFDLQSLNIFKNIYYRFRGI